METASRGQALVSEYRLQPFYLISLPVGIILLIVIMLFVMARVEPSSLIVAFVALELLAIYLTARYPYRIRTFEDGTVEFRGLLRKTRMAASDISGIRSHPIYLRQGNVRLTRWSGFAIIMSVHLDGFHNLLTWLEKHGASSIEFI